MPVKEYRSTNWDQFMKGLGAIQQGATTQEMVEQGLIHKAAVITPAEQVNSRIDTYAWCKWRLDLLEAELAR